MPDTEVNNQQNRTYSKLPKYLTAVIHLYLHILDMLIVLRRMLLTYFIKYPTACKGLCQNRCKRRNIHRIPCLFQEYDFSILYRTSFSSQYLFVRQVICCSFGRELDENYLTGIFDSWLYFGFLELKSYERKKNKRDPHPSYFLDLLNPQKVI